MSSSNATSPPVVVVTGGNGFVGSRTCSALAERGTTVRAVVRRPGTAPAMPGVEECVGEFNNPEIAAAVVKGASAVVTTAHFSPYATDRETQHRVTAEDSPALARAARDAGVDRLVHISTTHIYERSPGAGDVDEASPLVADDPDDDYAVTKRDTDAALAEIDGLTRVLVRPSAILGPGERSTWNTVVPAMVRSIEEWRHWVPGESFAWVHVNDLAAFVADVASGLIATSTDPEEGPVAGGCTVVNVAAGRATIRDYLEAVTGALGVEPVWDEEPAWTGRILAGRAARWGWTPTVDLHQALAELDEGLRR